MNIGMSMYECTYVYAYVMYVCVCIYAYVNAHDSTYIYECVIVMFAYAMYVCKFMNVHMCIYVICNVM